MLFTLATDVAKRIFVKERNEAIRFLREAMTGSGCCPDLRTCRDIVDKIQFGAVETHDLGEKSFVVRVRE